VERNVRRDFRSHQIAARRRSARPGTAAIDFAG
jgi:hypothetical protein